MNNSETKNEIYTYDNMYVICPYCGEKHLVDSETFPNEDIEFDDAEFECRECERSFFVQRQVTFLYNTYIKDSESDE